MIKLQVINQDLQFKSNKYSQIKIMILTKEDQEIVDAEDMGF